MKNLLFAVLALFSATIFAADIQVTQPTKDMSGSYIAKILDSSGNEMDTPFSGSLLEVFPAGEAVLGTTFPAPFFFGSLYFPATQWMTFQSTDAGTAYYNGQGQYKTTFNVVFASVSLDPAAQPQINVLGNGTVTLDPLATGDGHTMDVSATFNPAIGVMGQEVSSMTVRLHRMSNAPVYACLPAPQFGPAPISGTDLCN